MPGRQLQDAAIRGKSGSLLWPASTGQRAQEKKATAPATKGYGAPPTPRGAPATPAVLRATSPAPQSTYKEGGRRKTSPKPTKRVTSGNQHSHSCTKWGRKKALYLVHGPHKDLPIEEAADKLITGSDTLMRNVLSILYNMKINTVH